MTSLTHNQLRQKFIEFFAARDHLILPSGPLVPKGDDSTLFTTAGVQPLIPYLKMEREAPASRLVDAQKCLRTNDIDEVGDDSHLTMFEMLGSWSIGDYGKSEAIRFAYDFLTTEEGIALPEERLWFTVFAGSTELPADNQAAEIWQEIGVPKTRIAFLPESDNWWATGPEGLCGPDTEIFYDLKWPAPVPAGQNPGNDPDGRFIEIWNTVFMSYDRRPEGLQPLATQNIDEGAGLERLLAVVNGKNIYDTSCFSESLTVLNAAAKVQGQGTEKSLRIVADHLRTCLFILSEEPKIYPSASDHGYVLRRLIRSATKHGQRLGIDHESYKTCLRINAGLYKEQYPETGVDVEAKISIFMAEQAKFEKILDRAPKVWAQFTRAAQGDEPVSADIVFRMVTEQGIPFDIVQDIAAENDKIIDVQGYQGLMGEHKSISRASPPANKKS